MAKALGDGFNEVSIFFIFLGSEVMKRRDLLKLKLRFDGGLWYPAVIGKYICGIGFTVMSASECCRFHRYRV